jgi:nucleotide-binding universal stress UspA family protein
MSRVGAVADDGDEREFVMKSADEIVIDRAIEVAKQPDTAAIKSVLFAVHDDDGLRARLQAALSLARACSAHLHLLQVIPLEAYTVVDTYGGTFASGEIVEALEEEAGKVRRQLETQLRKEDVSWSYEVTRSLTIPELMKHAALADLLFIGRQPHWRDFNRTGPGLLGSLVCRTRTPLCIPGDGRESFDPFGTAIIAWNGSVEGANAVRSAIGVLRMASTVRIVRFVGDETSAFPDTRLLQYLSRHGIHAEMESRVAKKDVSADLVDFATSAHSEYVVMGGYSHSRAGEFLFGGVTRELLAACPISLMMAH